MRDLWLVLIVAATAAPAGFTQETPAPVEATPRLVATAHEGAGLAKKYPGDVGIEKDPRVLFVERFEDDALAERWHDRQKHPGSLSFCSDPADVHGGKRSLRVDYTPGENTGGHLYRKLDAGHEKLFLRFYVKFPEGHGYVHHFVQLSGYFPPTPWPQGGAGLRPKGNDSFTTTLDIYGDWGRTKPPGRWGFYSYWCEMKKAPDGKYWGNEPKPKRPILAATDRWVCAELMLKCNTVGKADGEQAFWIDGVCGGHWTGYRWRTDERLAINSIWLKYYVTKGAVERSRGKVRPEHVFFDDVVLATEYIGPAKRAKKR